MDDICPQCRYEPPVERHSRPGTRPQDTSTTHYSDCPTLPQLSYEARMRLQEHLEEIAAYRRRAMASARNYVIG